MHIPGPQDSHGRAELRAGVSDIFSDMNLRRRPQRVACLHSNFPNVISNRESALEVRKGQQDAIRVMMRLRLYPRRVAKVENSDSIVLSDRNR
jgi:hypothetical protein